MLPHESKMLKGQPSNGQGFVPPCSSCYFKRMALAHQNEVKLVFVHINKADKYALSTTSSAFVYSVIRVH